MSETFDCTSEDGRVAGIEAAVTAVRDHRVVVLPTDTVYGVGADAFSPEAVRAVLDAKGRGSDMPPPVLIPHARTADGLATGIPGYARDLMEAFWPGPLTLVLLAQPSLMWDLGDTNGTVALRVPQDPIALELLEQVGPMAVTSANLTGRPAALTAREALLMLGDAVAVYLDGGPCTDGDASTILDCTQEAPRVLRPGALAVEELQRVLGDVALDDGTRFDAAHDPDVEPELDPELDPRALGLDEQELHDDHDLHDEPQDLHDIDAPDRDLDGDEDLSSRRGGATRRATETAPDPDRDAPGLALDPNL